MTAYQETDQSVLTGERTITEVHDHHILSDLKIDPKNIYLVNMAGVFIKYSQGNYVSEDIDGGIILYQAQDPVYFDQNTLTMSLIGDLNGPTSYRLTVSASETPEKPNIDYIYSGDIISLASNISTDRTDAKYWSYHLNIINDLLKSKIHYNFLKQHGITDREWQVCEYLALGIKNKEIAKVLSISEHTVHAHQVNIFAKLNVHSKAGLTVLLNSIA